LPEITAHSRLISCSPAWPAGAAGLPGVPPSASSSRWTNRRPGRCPCPRGPGPGDGRTGPPPQVNPN